MPGLASADPHTLPTLSISRMNGGPRSSTLVGPARNLEQVHATEQSRVDQRRGSVHQKDKDFPHFDLRAAEESLSLYCKPVELYNIIQRRALRNPFFLQRCLSYKIEAGHQRRIKLTISIVKVSATPCEIRLSTGKSNGRCTGLVVDSQDQAFHSVLVMLTSPVSMPGTGCAGFRLSQTRVLRANLSFAENIGQPAVTFILPEVRKLLLNAKRDGAVIIFITCANLNPVYNGKGTQIESSVSSNGPVLWGSISLLSLCQGWLSPGGNVGSAIGANGEKLERTLHLDLFPSRLQLEDSSDGRCVSFQSASSAPGRKSMARLQLSISGEEVGGSADKVRCTNGSLFSYGRVSTCASLPHARRLQPGQVVFHYYYHFNQLYKSEVTDNYSCPFCVVCCSSFKGLRCHLNSTHDLFSFEFLATAEYRLVDVSCRNDLLGPEGNVRDVDGLNDPRLKNFVYWSRSGRPRKSCSLAAASVGSLHSEGQAPGPEKEGTGIDESHSQDPVSSAHPVSSAPLESCVPLNSSPLSPEQTLSKEDPAADSLELSQSQHVVSDAANTTVCNSIPTDVALPELSESKVNDDSLVEPSRKHERSEEQEQICKDSEDTLPVTKKQRSEVTTVDEVRTEICVAQNLASISANGVCLATAAPTLAEDHRIQSAINPEVTSVISRVEKSRKAVVERSEARIRSHLQKRQFFHSHTAQTGIARTMLMMS